MSFLNLTRRNTVIFDAKNSEHRQAFGTFLRTGTWGQSNVNFLLETPYYDLPAMITSKLTHYYIESEFTPRKELRNATRIKVGRHQHARV
jgi:hypothetical protein